jgi:hypothetical protein
MHCKAETNWFNAFSCDDNVKLSSIFGMLLSTNLQVSIPDRENSLTRG